MRIPRRLARIVCAALLGCGLAPAHAALPAHVAAGHDLTEVGSGVLTWLRIGVYEAALYAPGGRYRPDAPASLVIQYRRGITREQLVEATAKAWASTRPAPPSQRDAWLAELRAMWPDVDSGDVLAVLAVPGQPTTFHFNGTALGEVRDPEFGPAFLGVWLDPRTPSPKLRLRLLGDRP